MQAPVIFQVSWLLIAVPLLVAAVLLLVGDHANGVAPLLGVAGVAIPLGLAVTLLVTMLNLGEQSRAVTVSLYEWMSFVGGGVSFALLIDQLSILFVLLITGVGTLIFIYSCGYMADDPGRRRFFALMNLFIAAMLVLVLADSYLLLFVGWEGVGLASYLLIGFWQHKVSASLAAKKAFMVNKVGDLGLFAAIALMFTQFGSSDFHAVNARMDSSGSVVPVIMGFTLLLAALAKSAQVPLHTWLLDAMEGPTPVSALIHAATMVTAGIYLIVRSHAIFALAPSASLTVTIVGAVTIFVGAWIGATKDDIKKVLAASTMSQLGYLMVAAGLGPVGAAFAIFHLLAHGVFKANLFLGAGSVMHATGGETDMRVFGRLRRVLPWTCLAFFCGYLAIIGFPLTSGFYSKDHIIAAAFEQSMVTGVALAVGAALTALYMTRLWLLTFFGASRWDEDVKPHESSSIMVFPLVILGLASLGGGVALNAWIQGWLQPAIGNDVIAAPLIELTWQSEVAFGAVTLGVLTGWLLYRRPLAVQPSATTNPLVRAGANELGLNQAIDALIVRPGWALTSAVGAVETHVIEAGIDGIGSCATRASQQLHRMQGGNVRSYAGVVVIGTVIVVAALVIGIWL
ncbi:MAG: NADH-quinone oxidoreductase subunit L [Propionibacteriaceae bacterium]|jgi:NADH-quinone oxidoreductase subunit L|nr:NADH-quinone oxidoreductase subunit L [Propionibacteriaceae bacterium]